ncbi:MULTISPECIES: hypothetical protein, partial [unclassified Microcoleus]|uniref:hypothetical protein n=1 Tax=unclassified Microcoleus TaxID=2642155 RepID=UPI002FCF7048
MIDISHPFEALTAAKPSLIEPGLHNLMMMLVGCPAFSENTPDWLRYPIPQNNQNHPPIMQRL